MQHKCGEKKELIGMEARDAFSSSTSIMKKYTARLNYYGNRIKEIYKCSILSCMLSGWRLGACDVVWKDQGKQRRIGKWIGKETETV